LDEEFGFDFGYMYGVFYGEEIYQKTFGNEKKRSEFLRWRYLLCIPVHPFIMTKGSLRKKFLI
jgi:hypothetical protein